MQRTEHRKTGDRADCNEDRDLIEYGCHGHRSRKDLSCHHARKRNDAHPQHGIQCREHCRFKGLVYKRFQYFLRRHSYIDQGIDFIALGPDVFIEIPEPQAYPVHGIANDHPADRYGVPGIEYVCAHNRHDEENDN